MPNYTVVSLKGGSLWRVKHTLFFKKTFGHSACGILVLRPGTDLMPPAVETWSLDPWTASKLCLTLCDPMDCSPQAPLSMGFSRQEYWSGRILFLLQGIFLTQGWNPCLVHCKDWKLACSVFSRLQCPLNYSCFTPFKFCFVFSLSKFDLIF